MRGHGIEARQLHKHSVDCLSFSRLECGWQRLPTGLVMPRVFRWSPDRKQTKKTPESWALPARANKWFLSSATFRGVYDSHLNSRLIVWLQVIECLLEKQLLDMLWKLCLGGGSAAVRKCAEWGVSDEAETPEVSGSTAGLSGRSQRTVSADGSLDNQSWYPHVVRGFSWQL